MMDKEWRSAERPTAGQRESEGRSTCGHEAKKAREGTQERSERPETCENRTGSRGEQQRANRRPREGRTRQLDGTLARRSHCRDGASEHTSPGADESRERNTMERGGQVKLQ